MITKVTSIKMAQQSLFDTIVGVDNGTYLAVQSLLDAQSVQDTHPPHPPTPTNHDEEDVFQCGKCKLQFTSLQLFVSHKQQSCSGQMGGQAQHTAPLPQLYHHRQNDVTTATGPSFSQLPPNIVLPDDIMTLTLDTNNASAGTLHVQQQHGRQSNPFLSSVQLSNTNQVASSNQQAVLLGSYNTSTLALTPMPSTSQGHVQLQSLDLLPTQPGVNAVANQPQTVNSEGTGSMVTLLVEDRVPPSIQLAAPAPPSHPPTTTQPGNLSSTEGLLVQSQPTSQPTAIVKSKKKSKLKLIPKQPLSCQFCRKTFMKQFDLQQHIRAHTGERPFQCVVCGRGFSQKSNVKRHMQTHKVWPLGSQHPLPDQPPPQLMVVQEKDSRSSKNQNKTKESQTADGNESDDDDDDDDIGSMKWHFIIDSSYVCPYCPNAQTRFETYYQLKSHLVSHKTELVYKCIVKNCEKAFQELDDFLEHTKMHESRSELTYRCHECNRQFPSLDALGTHQYTHFFSRDDDGKRRKSEWKWKCIECGSLYTTPEGLEHHMSTTTHTHPCQHCGKVYTTPRLLRRHLASHKVAAEEFRCDICNKTMKSEHYLKAHKLIHTGELPFSCQQCGKRFNRKDKVARHMSIHDPVKKFVCPFKDITGCDKAFGRSDKLKEHVHKHTKINVDTVTSIPKGTMATSSNVVLLTNLPNSGNDVNSMLCKHCHNCRFETNEELLTHEVLCAQVPKLKCNKCELTFNTEENFESHQCKPIMEPITVTQVNSIKVNHVKKKPAKKKKTTRIELSPPRVKPTKRSRRFMTEESEPSPPAVGHSSDDRAVTQNLE